MVVQIFLGLALMSSLTSFKQLSLDEMTQEDLDLLATVVTTEDPEMDPKRIYGMLASGQMTPWRIESKRGNCILCTEIKNKIHERTLYVWYLCGKGIVGNGVYILDTLEAYGKLMGCSAIEALAMDGWAKYLTRPEGGFKVEHVFLKKEI